MSKGESIAGASMDARVFSDAAYSGLAIVLVGLSAALFNVLYGRAYGPADLGVVALGLAWALGAAQVVSAGLAPTLTRYSAFRAAYSGRRSAGAFLVRTNLFGLVLAGTATLIFLWILMGSGSAGERWQYDSIVVIALLLFLQCLYINIKASLYGLGEARSSAMAEILAGIGFAAGLIWLFIEPRPIMLAYLPFILANLLYLLPAGRVLARRIPSEESVGAERLEEESIQWLDSAGVDRSEMSVWRYALISFAGSAAAIARLHLVILLTGHWSSELETGWLQAAMTFLLPVMLIPRALELALFPALASVWGKTDRAQFQNLAGKALRDNSATLAWAAGSLFLACPWLLGRFFGESFQGALPACLYIILAAWLLGLAAPSVSMLSSAAGVLIPNIAGLLGLLTSLILWSLLIPARGAEGAAMGLAAGSAVNAIIPLVFSASYHDLGIGEFLKLHLPAMVLLSLAGILVFALAWPPLPIALLYALLLGHLEIRPRFLPRILAWQGRRV